MSETCFPLVSVVVIGRNESSRLARCLASINVATQAIPSQLIYVDSDSTDNSIHIAGQAGAEVIHASPEKPSAAFGRNVGWRYAKGAYILFLDGDTVLSPEFLPRALEAMQQDSVAVVWGHRREINPDQSIYVRVLDLDWMYPSGPSEFCGGDALIRRQVLEQVGGFDQTLIAGEEPELCRRLRHAGHVILHIDCPMTLHDLAITNFRAYWRRAFRAGYAYAELSSRFRNTDDPLWSRDARRNLVHAGALLLMSLMMVQWPMMTWFAGLAGLLLLGRTMLRCRWKSPSFQTLLLYAVHSHFQQIPILFGQLAHISDRRQGLRRGLIEYHR